MNVVTECLLHEEKKQKGRDANSDRSRNLAMMSRQQTVKYYHCGKPGYTSSAIVPSWLTVRRCLNGLIVIISSTKPLRSLLMNTMKVLLITSQ